MGLLAINLLPDVETLVYLWVIGWSTVAALAFVLVLMGWQTVRALDASGERRRAYHLWARWSLFRRALVLLLGVLMVPLGGVRLYAQVTGDYALLERMNYGQVLLLGISIIAPILALKLLSEWYAERTLLKMRER